MIHEGTLSIQTYGTPPLPAHVWVKVGEAVVAVVSLAELRRAAVKVDEMEVAAAHPVAPALQTAGQPAAAMSADCPPSADA